MIPCTGTIKASDINTELGRAPNAAFKIGSPEERALAGKPSGLIKFSDFACKSAGFDLGIGFFSGFAEQYAGFQNVGGLERADIGSINGQRPSPYFPPGSINNSVGFYFHKLAYSEANSVSPRFEIRCYGVPDGFSTDVRRPWGMVPVLCTMTASNGDTLNITTNNVYQSVSPDTATIKNWLVSRNNTTVKVSIRAV